MSNQHPITPPPELVQEWWDKVPGTFTSMVDETHLATQAAQWGADQELEACCRWIEDQLCMPPDARADVITQLNGSRRPKPPSLKEQALAELDRIPTHDNEGLTWGVDVFIIRKALEALPND